ncbi:hypothetical protein XENOCAPTIV_027521, partial [Xenoophorus captivus]
MFKATQTACRADVGAHRSEPTEAEEDQSHRELSGAAAACLALFCRGTQVKFRLCLRLLGLMASVLAVITLGRLHMRPFQ